jgi:putative SOS response-associated peptidase YedK
MCGRFAVTLPPEAVRAYFGYVEQPNFPPRYNVAPTQPVPIVRAERDADGEVRRHFRLVRWGFLPTFVKDPKDYPLVINARSETAPEKASFRNALRRRRCIFLADGFYEWLRPPPPRKKGDPLRPFLIRRCDRAPLAMAGLWENWMGPNGEEVETACVLTTDANGLMSAVHDRMPVILERDAFETWLSPDEDRAKEAIALMRPAENDVLDLCEVGPGVNKVANDGVWIQDPVAEAPPPARVMAPMKIQGELF